MDDIVKDFLIESGENLDRLDQELVKLETDPKSKELLASIFRTIHTIKGSCGFLGFARLEKVAHAGENLLSSLRDGEMSLSSPVTSALLAMVDAVRRMLSEIEATENDGDNDYPELRDKLKQLQAGRGEETTGTVDAALPVGPGAASTAPMRNHPEPPSAERPSAPEAASVPSVASAQPAPTKKRPGDTANQAEAGYRPTAGKMGGLLVDRGTVSQEDLATALREQELGDQRRLGEILVSLGLCKPEDIQAALQSAETRGREAITETVRVSVNLLDRLMTLVGELVLARNQMLQFSTTVQDRTFSAVSQRMNLITTELQEEVMKTRMQPIGNIWNKFPRTVRDLAHTCGKEVRLEMEGQETELDRTIIEAIKDPLTHLVRNSMDHGIESPEVRRHSGKGGVGLLKLRAFHEGGQVNIEISDDGAGLNGERIRKKAIERGVVTADQAARMPDRDVFNLIFLPGFSTAEKITNVSGRGVGMDVVKTNVEKIGGTVDIVSRPGQGTTVRVKIPLTLAIIPALVVRCIGERFAVPQISLAELVRLEGGKGIEMVQGSPVYRLRGQLLPLVYLREVLQAQIIDDAKLPADASFAADISNPKKTKRNLNLEIVNIVVLQAERRHFGLVVDDILDTEEIVVKPLDKQLKGITAYSGATIMGDGKVALILDVIGLAQRAKVISEAHEPSHDERQADVRKEHGGDTHTLLLAENGLEGRVAIPLSVVARLEEFPRTVVERAGEQEVMQYRGQIIPLLRLSQLVPTANDPDATDGSGSIQVVVYSEGAHTVGLIVDRIVDIVEERAVAESLTPRPGIMGSFVTQRHVTDLLDVPAIVRSAIPGLLQSGHDAGRA
jgi:two-component system, chemotaxis family, sensor kinase CheA